MRYHLFLALIIILAACQSPRPQPSTLTLAQVNPSTPSTDYPVSTATLIPPTVEPDSPSQPVGSIDAVFIQDEYAYLNQGADLIILDLSDPAHPVAVGSVGLTPNTNASAINVLDQYAYVMTGSLWIFDVSDPTHPIEVGSYQRRPEKGIVPVVAVATQPTETGSAHPPPHHGTGYTTMASPPPPPPRYRDIAVRRTETGRTYAYVAAHTAGLYIVDVSDPTTPVEVGAYEFEPISAATGIAVASNMAYLATQDGLRVVDVSNPNQPAQIAALPAVSWDVVAAGDRLYLVEGQCSPLDGCMSGSLQVVGISDPASPGRIGQTSLFYSQVVALDGENIYAGTRNGLVIFRQADPSQPVSYWPPTASLLIRDIAVKDNYLYLAAGSKGLKILNVAEATAPTQVGEFPPPRNQAQTPHWKAHTVEDGLLGASVTDILIDEAGRKPTGQVWIGTVGAVNVFDGQTWQTYTSATGLADRYVSALARDAAGQIWVGYANRDNPVGMSRFDGQRWQHFTKANDIVDIAVDPAGPIWFASRYGLAQFEGQNWNFYRFPQRDNPITAVAVDQAGKVWVGATSGLFDGPDWKPYSLSNPFADEILEDIAIDPTTGQVWLASLGNGVSVFDGRSVTTYTTTDGLVSNNVYAIAIDAAGHVWFGTENGVSMFDGQRWISYTTADGLLSGSVRAIAIDPAGHVWIGTENGVSEFIP